MLQPRQVADRDVVVFDGAAVLRVSWPGGRRGLGDQDELARGLRTLEGAVRVRHVVEGELGGVNLVGQGDAHGRSLDQKLGLVQSSIALGVRGGILDGARNPHLAVARFALLRWQLGLDGRDSWIGLR